MEAVCAEQNAKYLLTVGLDSAVGKPGRGGAEEKQGGMGCGGSFPQITGRRDWTKLRLCVAGAERRRTVAVRSAVAVFAKQNAKQRERLSEKQRVYNKARKSAIGTRMRKVR